MWYNTLTKQRVKTTWSSHICINSFWQKSTSIHDKKKTLNKMNIEGLCMHAKSLQLCLTLWDLMDCSPQGSSVRGILQAGILEWVTMCSSRGSSQSRNQIQVSCIPILLADSYLLGHQGSSKGQYLTIIKAIHDYATAHIIIIGWKNWEFFLQDQKQDEDAHCHHSYLT